MITIKKPLVIIGRAVDKEIEAYIAEHCEIKDVNVNSLSKEQFYKIIHDVEGLFAPSYDVNDELLNQATKLRVVSNIGVGYNNFDTEAMIRHQVIGTHTPSVLDDTVADLVMGLILATARRISELDRYIRKGLWTQNTNDNDIFGIDVHHSVLGIVGMGRIGEAIAKRAKYGFDMEVQYYNRNKKVDMEQRLGIQYLELDELLKTSDFVVMMTPLTHETKHFFGKREFQLMKNNAIFINASRGQTVDEQALLEALQNHEIVGAGLDVFDQEPIQPNHPFMQLPNIVMVPHIGSATTKTRTEIAWVAAKNIVAALTGQSIPNVIPEHKDLL